MREVPGQPKKSYWAVHRDKHTHVSMHWCFLMLTPVVLATINNPKQTPGVKGP
jgi:hypothetical protein